METVVVPKILLVDDDPLVGEVEQAILEDAGYAVLIAQSVEAALEILTAEDGQIGCLVTDINLGPGGSGWDLARSARGLLPSLPVIYVSGDSGVDWSAQGVPHSGMLNKPFAPSQLIVMVANQINASSGQDPPPP